MAVVEVDLDELSLLVGRNLDRDTVVDKLFQLGVEFEGESEDGLLEFEVVPDRPDRLSVEGLARSLRLDMEIDEGVAVPDVEESDYVVEVDSSVADVRPYTTGCVIRDVDLTGGVLDSLIQLQEKLHGTLGRRRSKGAIGVHDLAMLKGETIRYTAVDPGEEEFVPLEIGGDEAREMTPQEVMDEHPVGKEYSHLLEGEDTVPLFYDDIGVFSFPPVINGKRTEVREDTRDLFIELTGTDEWTVDKMLNIIVYALKERGCKVHEVEFRYPDRRAVKPDLSLEEKSVEHSRIESLLGVSFDEFEVVDLLRRSGLDAEPRESSDGTLLYDVTVPPYRTDVMHPVDLVDDVGRAYGFNSLEPRYPDVSTVGDLTEDTRLENAVRRQLVGLGFQDLLNFVLTNPADEYTAAGLDDDGEGVHIENPYSEEYEMMRRRLLPSIYTVLGNNTHREYPQNLSEVGVVAEQDDDQEMGVREETHVAGVVCGPTAGYEEAKSRLQSLVEDFDCELETPAKEGPSFVPGRSAAVEIDGEEAGVIGEVHPEVLERHEVVQPAAAFEIELAALR